MVDCSETTPVNESVKKLAKSCRIGNPSVANLQMRKYVKEHKQTSSQIFEKLNALDYVSYLIWCCKNISLLNLNLTNFDV